MSDIISQPDAAGGDLQAAAERANDRNLPQFDDMPISPNPLGNGVALHPQCKPVAQLLGMWRGRGEAEYPSLLGQFQYGQQIIFSHDGRPFLAYETRAWLLNQSGQVLGPAAREVGWWRVDSDEAIEMVLAHAFGICEIYYGGPTSEDSWELSTDAVVRSDTARETTEATRTYAILDDGTLAYVEERALRRLPKQHHLAAQLQRVAD